MGTNHAQKRKLARLSMKAFKHAKQDQKRRIQGQHHEVNGLKLSHSVPENAVQSSSTVMPTLATVGDISGGSVRSQQARYDANDAVLQEVRGTRRLQLHRVTPRPIDDPMFQRAGVKMGEPITEALMAVLLANDELGIKTIHHGWHVFEQVGHDGHAFPVLAVRFNNIAEMTAQDNDDLVTLMRDFPVIYENSLPCKTNAAHAVGGGVMHPMGARPDFTTGASAGTYVPAHRDMPAHLYKELNWRRQRIGCLFTRRLHDMLPYAYQVNVGRGRGLPDIANADILGDPDDAAVFTSIVLSTKDPKSGDIFWNVLHLDNDASVYTMGIVYHTQDQRRVESADVLRKNVTGGGLYFPTLGVYIDMSRCDGFVDKVWRGPIEPHLTVQSTVSPAFSRWGSSAQINERLYNIYNADLRKDENGTLDPNRIVSVRDRLATLPTRDQTAEEREQWQQDEEAIKCQEGAAFQLRRTAIEFSTRPGGVKAVPSHEIPARGALIRQMQRQATKALVAAREAQESEKKATVKEEQATAKRATGMVLRPNKRHPKAE